MNNTSPSISVILILDGERAVHQDALGCIAEQTLKPTQLLVVSDAAHRADVFALRAAIPNLQTRYIECGRTDLVYALAARNACLDHIGDCRYIHLIDRNTRFPKDFYQNATQGLEEQPNCVAAFPTQLQLPCRVKAKFVGVQPANIEEDESVEAEMIETEVNCSEVVKKPWLWLLYSEYEMASGALLRTSAVQSAGKFNASLLLGADIDFFARMANQGPWYCVPECTVWAPVSYIKADLREQFADYYRRWSLVYETVLDTHKARERIPRRIYRTMLAKSWWRAGRQLLDHQRLDEARDCFLRSLSWRLLNPSLEYLIKIRRLRKRLREKEATPPSKQL